MKGIEMPEGTSEIGRRRRLDALFRDGSHRALVVAIDHGLFMGPVPGASILRDTVAGVLAGNPHGIQLTPGAVRTCGDLLASTSAALVYRLDMTNAWRSDRLSPTPGYWAPVGTPIDAVRCGASVAVAFVLGGWADDSMERENFAQLAEWSRECRDLGLPFMLEPLPLSGKVTSRVDGQVVRVLARIATEIGCDLLKLDYDGDADAFTELLADASVPVLVRGGPKASDRRAFVSGLAHALALGARGLVVGRNAFEGPDAAAHVAELRGLVDARPSVED
jgi:DhnA family fructose-bisphosphate aldolase class Ia